MTPIINRQKKGISVVLTTLIIVVASVVLGTAVTLFGTSLFQTGAQQQGIAVTNAHLWYNSTDFNHQFEGAVAVRNTGDKLVAVDTIAVRGVQVTFGNWTASSPTATTIAQTQAQFAYQSAVPASAAGTNYNIDKTGTTVTLTTGTGPVSIPAGKSVIIYFVAPKGILTSADVGSASSLNLGAGQITSVQTVTVGTA